MKKIILLLLVSVLSFGAFAQTRQDTTKKKTEKKSKQKQDPKKRDTTKRDTLKRDTSITSLLPGATDTDFFRKAGMLDSKIVQGGNLADPAEVAKDGYEAMLAGKDMVVSGFKNKILVALGNLTPDSVQAAQMGKMQEPVSGDK